MSTEEDARRLRELDRQISRSLAEGSSQELSQLLSEYIDLRRGILKATLRHPVLFASDQESAVVLRRVGSDSLLPTDDWLRNLFQRELDASYEIFNIDELSDEDIEELASELFLSWTSHIDFIRELMDLRPLVISGSAPEPLIRLIEGARYCYALQQYDATYALCRSAIEAAARDIADRQGLFPEYGGNVRRLDLPWFELRDSVATGPLRRRLMDVYRELCRVIHVKRTAGSSEARKMYLDSVEMIEDLYSWNGF